MGTPHWGDRLEDYLGSVYPHSTGTWQWRRGGPCRTSWMAQAAPLQNGRTGHAGRLYGRQPGTLPGSRPGGGGGHCTHRAGVKPQEVYVATRGGTGEAAHQDFASPSRPTPPLCGAATRGERCQFVAEH